MKYDNGTPGQRRQVFCDRALAERSTFPSPEDGFDHRIAYGDLPLDLEASGPFNNLKLSPEFTSFLQEQLRNNMPVAYRCINVFARTEEKHPTFVLGVFNRKIKQISRC
jgi:hypothetical protein